MRDGSSIITKLRAQIVSLRMLPVLQRRGDAYSSYTGSIFTKFSELGDLWVEMIDLTFVFRSLKG